jgi:Raf kinase inhibitor-like YbhB/YbcL family protein
VLRLCTVLISLIACSCGAGNIPAANTNQVGNQDTKPGSPGKPPTLLKISSTAFPHEGVIPRQYTCDGPNVSPPLIWAPVPEGTKSFALICDDPDAPGKTWVHWVLFGLPPTTRELPEKVPPQSTLPSGARQGTNDFKKIGYGGPCPPSGSHRYYFKLYALDTELTLDSGATKDQLLKAMEGHILAQGQLMGRYQRQ